MQGRLSSRASHGEAGAAHPAVLCMRAWRFVVGAGPLVRAAAVCVLCIATFAVCLADLRFETLRSGLLPGVATGKWGVSHRGVAVLKSDPSVAILAALKRPQFAYLINQIGNPASLHYVRVQAEMATRRLRPGREHWQRARILFWSYGAGGKRLRYLPHEVGALDGSTDWHRLSLVVPVVPETRYMRLIIYNGGLAGTMYVRNLTVDDVGETPLFDVLKPLLIALWVAVGVWALLPLAAAARRRPMAAAVVVAGAVVLGGTLTPQPTLSDLLAPAEQVAKRVAAPLVEKWTRTEPDIPVALPAAPARVGDEGGAGPPSLRVAGASPAETGLFASVLRRAEQIPGDSLAHFTAYAGLGLLLSLAFPAVGWRPLFVYLTILSVSTETLQGFYFTRTPEFGDIAANLVGTFAGFAAWLLCRRFVRRWAA